MEEKTYKAALYCRLSEEDRNKENGQSDSGSIINQKALLTRYCEEKGWQIYDIYSDDDYTGSDRNRPEFNRMLSDAEAKKFDVILCKTQSRFTREIELVERYINYLLPLWGIRFVSVVDNADTDVKSNRKARQINGLINEWYLEDMSENIKAVLTERRKNGYFIGAFAPYGYKKDPYRKGHLIIDEEAAENVRLIFSLYVSGMGRTAIARELNARHILTPAAYKKSRGEKYRNNYKSVHNSLWRYFTVGNILANEVYTGNLVQNKAHSVSYKSKVVKPTDKSEWIRAENTHEAIIDSHTWETAQKMTALKTRPFYGNNTGNIFSRNVFCSECGKNMKISKHKNRKYLRCSTKFYAPEECAGTNINYEKLCGEVLGEFKKIAGKLTDNDKLASFMSESNRTNKALGYYIAEYDRIYSLTAENETYLKNLYIDKVKGIVDEDTYNELYSCFYAEKAEFEKQLKETEKRIAFLREENNISVSSYIESCLSEIHFETVNVFIEKIVVHPKKRYSREDNIEIFWNF